MDRQRITDYFCSLPERSIRSISALAGGAVREIGQVALPGRLRRSRLYDALVESTARFLIEQVGQVDLARNDVPLPDDFLVRRAAGNVVEIAGFAAFRASPVWVLAALSDIAGSGRELIQEITAALQKEDLLEQGRTFDSVDQLLDGLERTSGRLAGAMNTPPLNVKDLRDEWEKLRVDAARIPGAVLPSGDRLRTQWRELQDEAAAQGRSVMELSSAMALSALRHLPEDSRWLSAAVRVGGRRAGEVVARGLLDHYRTTLAEIREIGFGRYWLREFRPYLSGAVRQFVPERLSSTERFLKKRRGLRQPRQ
jgi:hypothetical protein